jgi:hypothetical protein
VTKTVIDFSSVSYHSTNTLVLVLVRVGVVLVPSTGTRTWYWYKLLVVVAALESLDNRVFESSKSRYKALTRAEL